MAEEKRLIGNDGSLVKVTIGASGTTLAIGAWGRITAKASSASIFDDLAIGEFYFNTTTAALTLSGGDTISPLTITPMLDINGWDLKLTATEVDVTVLKDKYKKYRKGKLDAEGTVAFVWIKGITDLAGGIANDFFDIAVIDATGNATVTRKNTDPTYLLGYLDVETASGKVASATLFQVEFFDFTVNVKDNEASNQSPKFRLAGDADPILYRLILA